MSKNASETEHAGKNEKQAGDAVGEAGAAQEKDVYEEEAEQEQKDDYDQTGGEIAASAYYSDHDLREMFSRENAERRRQGSKMLRRLLTTAQDKKVMSQMVKIRERYDVANNDDIILAWVKQQVEAGKADDYDPKLVQIAQETVIPERDGPFEPRKGH